MPNPMYTSSSAMTAYSTAMGMYADNTANAQTCSAKRSTPSFSSQVTGGTGGGGGLAVSQRKLIEQSGLLQPSDLPTDCGIAGDGFFVVKRDPGDKDYLFSRKGDFTPNAHGDLTNSAGHCLMALETDRNGKPLEANVTNVSSLKPVNINTVNGISRPTENCTLKINLDSRTAVDDYHITPMTFYDNLGVGHNLMCKWTRLDPMTELQWNLDIMTIDGDQVDGDKSEVLKDSASGAEYKGLKVTFNSDGTPQKWDTGLTAGDPPPKIFIKWANAAGETKTAINLDFGSSGTPGVLDGIQCLGGSSNNAFVGQDGIKYGNYNGVSISEDGIITARFDNGQTVPIYKIPLANFASVNELEGITGNAYLETRQSGSYVLNSAGVNGMGKIESGALESSNTDLAVEFVGVMITNRAYAANAKMITVADRMLETVESILR